MKFLLRGFVWAFLVVSASSCQPSDQTASLVLEVGHPMFVLGRSKIWALYRFSGGAQGFEVGDEVFVTVSCVKQPCELIELGHTIPAQETLWIKARILRVSEGDSGAVLVVSPFPVSADPESLRRASFDKRTTTLLHADYQVSTAGELQLLSWKLGDQISKSPVTWK